MITIVLPVRNGGIYLPLAVNSIIAQTDQNWRLIILENASEDDTPAYLASLSDPRISVRAASRPLSIEESWGRIKDLNLRGLTTLLGHDDVLHPEFLERAIADESAHSTASLWMSHFQLIDANGNFIRRSQAMPERESGIEYLHNRWMNRRDSYGTGYVFRFEDYVEAGGIPAFPGLLYADDYIWSKLARKSYLYCSPESRFSYRTHAESSARVSSSLMGIQGAAYLIEALIVDALRNRELSDFLRKFGRRFMEHSELCFWQSQVRSCVQTKVRTIAIPTGWTEIRRRFPVRPNSLKSFVLRHYWAAQFKRQEKRRTSTTVDLG